jgi:hypothetical protein
MNFLGVDEGARKMKCDRCGCYDSLLDVFYVDRNGEYFSESELEAFRILHPEARGVNFRIVWFCGVCAYELGLR